MYTGRMIEELLTMVERAEKRSSEARWAPNSGLERAESAVCAGNELSPNNFLLAGVA